jgi:uncharacterized protein (UPF0276 family)
VSVRAAAARIPVRAGIGLRAPHYRDVLESRPRIGWLEVHSENYFGAGGPPLHYLQRIREHYPISLHGVGMSLGSTDPLDTNHLARLKALIARIEPGLVSDHLSWSSVNRRYFNDLLPLPYTEEALGHVCGRVTAAQDFLGCRLLVENPSTYLQYPESSIPEPEFMAELARRTGCGLLIDVNNVYVSACNQGFDARRYLDSIPRQHVAELHLAGFTRNQTESGEILIDTHSRPVAAEVWALYVRAIQRFGELPTLVEWDAELPPLALLVAESGRAQSIMDESHARAA